MGRNEIGQGGALCFGGWGDVEILDGNSGKASLK